MRGYLWVDLEGEIAAEFEQVHPFVRAYDSIPFWQKHGWHIEGALGDMSGIRRSDKGRRRGTLSTPSVQEGRTLRKKMGLCIDCESKRDPKSKNYCPKHREKSRQRASERRLKNPLTSNSAKELRARRLAAGQCLHCDKFREPDSKNYCKRHRDDDNRRRVQKRKEKRGMKERLNTDRSGTTHHFTITTKCQRCAGFDQPRENCQLCRGAGVHDIKGYVTANVYPDGRLGEIFINVGKTSSGEAWIDQWARAASFALQYGAPVDEFFGKFVATRFEPSGATSNKDIRRCTSILDYASRYLLQKFGTKEAAERSVVVEELKAPEVQS